MRSLVDVATELWALMLVPRLPMGVFPPAKTGLPETCSKYLYCPAELMYSGSMSSSGSDLDSLHW